MIEFLLVGLGGAIGAMLRYAISLFAVKGDFPYTTLCINFMGAFVIGLLAASASKQYIVSAHSMLLLKTGVCGGFTTFSTFSLEALTLLEQHKTSMAVVYIIASILLCLLGVYLGKHLISA